MSPQSPNNNKSVSPRFLLSEACPKEANAADGEEPKNDPRPAKSSDNPYSHREILGNLGGLTDAKFPGMKEFLSAQFRHAAAEARLRKSSSLAGSRAANHVQDSGDEKSEQKDESHERKETPPHRRKDEPVEEEWENVWKENEEEDFGE